MDNKNFVANEEATFVAPSQNSPEMNSQPETAVAPSLNHPGPPPDYFTDDLPPAYQVASALPTYEEAELTKGKIKEELPHNGVKFILENCHFPTFFGDVM